MSNAENAVASRLDADRKGLLDLSLRNPLLNYVPRARGVEVVGESPAQVFAVLVRERKRMAFQPVVGSRSDAPPVPNDDPEAQARLLASRADLKLETALPADQLQSRLLATYYGSRASLEEQGVNSLFLALGMLDWTEPDDPARRLRAPLLLVPVELERSHARDRFRLRATDEDLEVNLSLAEKLNADHAIDLPAPPDAEELDVDRYFGEAARAVEGQPHWSVDRGAIVLGFFSFGKFRMYRDLDDDVWPVGSKPGEHPILRALLQDGFDGGAPALDDEEPLDRYFPPAESHLVVDADSSQALAILEVNRARNLVIQGPPGTGKSQTITNLIAEALGKGHTVLFVSEKLAALEVVKRRLDGAGLGDACLELHSQKASKKGLLDELRKTLELGRPRLKANDDDLRLLVETRDRLNAYAEAVNAPIGDSGVSPFAAFGALLRLRGEEIGAAPLPLEIATMAEWPRYDLRRRRALVEELQGRLAVVGVPRDHPFWGSRRTLLLPTEGDRLRDLLGVARRASTALRNAADALATRLGLPPRSTRAEAEMILRASRRVAKAGQLHGAEVCRGDWLAHRGDLHELLDAGKALAALHERHDATLLPDAWDDDLRETRLDLNAHGREWWRFLSPTYRRACRKVASLCRDRPPRTFEDQLGLVDAVLEAARHRDVVGRHAALGSRLFASRWQGERSNWSALAQLTKWSVQLHLDIRAQRLPEAMIEVLASDSAPEIADSLVSALKEALGAHQDAWQRLAAFLELDASARLEGGLALEHLDFAAQAALLDLWEERRDALSALVAFNHLADRCRLEGLAGVVAIAESWPDASRHLVSLFDRHWFETLLALAFREREALAGFDGRGHEHVIRTFRDLDRQSLRHNRARLAREHWERLPRHDGGGQLAVLRREFEKKSRHLPVRQLLSRAGNAVRAIKPVFMMSPLSVAEYLAPGSWQFDLVIFDEASQVKPVDALGAILRGKQVVVVGDSRQLPPTNFFERLTGEEDEDEESSGDVESILGLFASQGAPQRVLRWHYRSRHESLIAVSNHEFYDDRLVVFPSPDAGRRESGLVVHHLPQTAYDRGKTRTNPDEAEAVARAVFAHARAQLARPAGRRLTLGVAAFSVAQMEAIRDRVERLRREEPACEPFFATDVLEPFFVKNLENVQGDERDLILISVGYGRTADGELAMSFGPLNGDGGERRLNVLITRARVRCEVFTNLSSSEIDLSRTRARGVQALKTFLAYAEGRAIVAPRAGDTSTDAPFEEAVRKALADAGHGALARVGPAIDLAVVDPNREGHYVLGITCDGPSYHDARSARDRDRLRTEVLEALGWRLCPVWSTDWVRNPSGESRRVLAAIAGALAEPAADPATSGPRVEDGAGRAAGATDLPAGQAPAFDRDDPAVPLPSAPPLPAYAPARLNGESGAQDLETLPIDQLATRVASVVNAESPVHHDEVAIRISEAAGVKRISPRLRSALESACDEAARAGTVRRQGDFLWQPAMTVPVVRDRRALPSTSRKLDLVATEEVGLAIEKVVGDSLGIEPEALPTQTCHLLGFPRVNDEMRSRVESIVTQLLADGRLVRVGEHLMLAAPPDPH